MKNIIALALGAVLLTGCTGVAYKQAPDRVNWKQGPTQVCDHNKTLVYKEMAGGILSTATIYGAVVGIPMIVSATNGLKTSDECLNYLNYRAKQEYLAK